MFTLPKIDSVKESLSAPLYTLSDGKKCFLKPKKINKAFGNVSKLDFSKKLRFEM